MQPVRPCCILAATAASSQHVLHRQLLLHVCSQWCISAASGAFLSPVLHVCSQYVSGHEAVTLWNQHVGETKHSIEAFEC